MKGPNMTTCSIGACNALRRMTRTTHLGQRLPLAGRYIQEVEVHRASNRILVTPHVSNGFLHTGYVHMHGKPSKQHRVPLDSTMWLAGGMRPTFGFLSLPRRGGYDWLWSMAVIGFRHMLGGMGCGRFVIKSVGEYGSQLSTKIVHSVEVLFPFWQVPSVQLMLHKGSPSMRGCDSEDRR